MLLLYQSCSIIMAIKISANFRRIVAARRQEQVSGKLHG